MTTQIIEIAEDGKSAQATTYFTGIHFGQGKWKGKQVTAWGKYTDSLVPVDDADAGGLRKWIIKAREVQFFKRLGEEGVLEGE